MSRTIKFRAWDKVYKKMIDTPMAICSGDNNGAGWVMFTAEIENMDCSNAIHPIQQYEIMQFTGLTDHNGVETYEGDIVVFQTFDAQGIVTYEAPSFVASGHDLQGYEVEVIGNVYQHPQLLEAQ